MAIPSSSLRRAKLLGNSSCISMKAPDRILPTSFPGIGGKAVPILFVGDSNGARAKLRLTRLEVKNGGRKTGFEGREL